MARVAIIPGGIRSKLITACELGARLEHAGFNTTIVAPPDAPVDESGIECVRSEFAIDTADVDGFKRCLAEIAPDLILIDIEAHAEIMVAVCAGHRVALINVFFNLWKHPGMPPVHVPITPGVGLAGTKPGIEWAWLRYRAWRWWMLRRSRRNGNDYLTRLEALAQRLAFPLSREVDYYQGLLPYIYRERPILNTNLMELDLPHEPHSNSRYVGPMTSVDRRRLAFSREEQAIANDIGRISTAAADSGRKLVYCAFGAYYMGDDMDFWRRVLAAASTRPDWCFVLGLGGRLEPAALGPLPDNVHAFRWAPQMLALQHADAAVIHGGMTSVYECIHHEVPMLSYPYAAIFDQFGTAARIRYHGIGVDGDRRRSTPAQIAAGIEQVLEDANMLDRVVAMRKHMDRYRSENRLVNEVSGMITQSGIAGSAAAGSELPAKARR